MRLQSPSIILPTVWTTGLETLTVADALTHVSTEFGCQMLEYKTVHVTVTEVVAFGPAGTLNCWIELSPYPTSLTGTYWAAIGGGGGAMPPIIIPLNFVGTGVNLSSQSGFINWNVNSVYARLIVQTPLPSLTAIWILQAQVSGA